ncbi:helicase-related protein [Variovorax sp. 350MFTsu5.1]|uniref:helicase-related protein n=1 Tax=Variovorax sp. 350MFTsu5.1 TaxID=3158365 RepID=UPI003AB0C5F5
MKERSELIESVRSEIVGPARHRAPTVVTFSDKEFKDSVLWRRGALAWKPFADGDAEEVLYFEGESPHRKYGVGMLHPLGNHPIPSTTASEESDTLGAEMPEADSAVETSSAHQASGDNDDTDADQNAADRGTDEDFEVTGGSTRRPSTLGISFCMSLPVDAKLLVALPSRHRFSWQEQDDAAFPVNGRYEKCGRRWIDDKGRDRRDTVWRRNSAVGGGVVVEFSAAELASGTPIKRDVVLPVGSPVRLRLDCFPRAMKGKQGQWLITLVLRNTSVLPEGGEEKESILFQSFFEVTADRGTILPYPESTRSFESLDKDEQSLALLYRESAIFGVGHGCAAAWSAAPGEEPSALQADAMPSVELPSMTPDIMLEGRALSLKMRDLADLPANGTGPAWDALQLVSDGYRDWIAKRQIETASLPERFRDIAQDHLNQCHACLDRIDRGITLIRNSAPDRDAFRLANKAMLLQQIATKQTTKRDAAWDPAGQRIVFQSAHVSPWDVLAKGCENGSRIGSWRAFQIAFLLLSLSGLSDPSDADRDIVDLIWFPTGGGKTEAYLAAMAFYMFRERLKMQEGGTLQRDATNVLMRYTLRMLTTQQFQRAASLICAMEVLRRESRLPEVEIPGRRFSLGLWVGGDGSPNKCSEASTQYSRYLKGDLKGNPLVLTECPWCRAQIGKLDSFTRGKKAGSARALGVSSSREGPMLHCPDPRCAFGAEDPDRWLPVEVIDERIYRYPPSLLIATADKFAMMAYRPGAGALFGRAIMPDGKINQDAMPPGLIIQDELHLISGPLGTMYALYESIFEQLCTTDASGVLCKPKIVASTATIRGAEDQVKVLYGRERTSLFPSPGLSMSDSFFGRYAKEPDGRMSPGRLYVGVHGVDHGSILTTQVRAFAAALYKPAAFDQTKRDPWWTLLAFYNSIRELGGARTLFDSDIRSRLKFLFNREGIDGDGRRTLAIVDELTSRLSQPEIVAMMDRLARTYETSGGAGVFDACLASNIIEVGVDIDRLSLMGVVGQPKTTSTYIQVTGRVGRKWQERPGLILTLYNPSKSRDRSHFEQFHGYHRRLYERVEPTSATPFAISAIQRGFAGAVLTWARQQVDEPVRKLASYRQALDQAVEILINRCSIVQNGNDAQRSISELRRMHAELIAKWQRNPQEWEQFPQSTSGEYLMLWPGQYATQLQEARGVKVPTSMRQVDRTGEFAITPAYAMVSGSAGSGD